MSTLRTQDTSDLRHFGTSAEVSIRHFGNGHFGMDTSAPVPNCPDISALVPKCLGDTSALSKILGHCATLDGKVDECLP